jgi:hypothetical protein
MLVAYGGLSDLQDNVAIGPRYTSLTITAGLLTREIACDFLCLSRAIRAQMLTS